MKRANTLFSVVCSCLLLTWTQPLYAEDDSLNNEQPTLDEAVTKHTNTQLIDRISGDFDQLLASQDDPMAVVTGLRSGNEFVYNGETLQATGGMGYGNVVKVLALTEHNGGNMQEILAMRNSGMGWGEIAHSLDTTVGAQMNRINHPQVLPTTTSTIDTRNTSTRVSTPSPAQSNNGYRPSGVGITDGLGNSITSPGVQRGHAYGQSKKPSGPHAKASHNSSMIRSGAGAGISSGISSGLNQGSAGNGNAYGHGKKSK